MYYTSSNGFFYTKSAENCENNRFCAINLHMQLHCIKKKGQRINHLFGMLCSVNHYYCIFAIYSHKFVY